MTLSEAAEVFIEQAKREAASDNHSFKIGIRTCALESLKTYCSTTGAKSLDDLTREHAHDFMARWLVEEIEMIQEAGTQLPERSQSEAVYVRSLLDALFDFFNWFDENDGARSKAFWLAVIDELKQSLPLAFEIKESIGNHFSQQAGPFGFPEFLTSFEEGGHSSTDALEGYFRVARVEGRLIEAEELITQAHIWPIVFPIETAPLIAPGYILSLEIIRVENTWEIASSGFVYPPGTAVL